MSEFKVGDKAIVTGDTADTCHAFVDGTEVTLLRLDNFDGQWNVVGKGGDGNITSQWVHPDDLKLVEPETNQGVELLDPKRLAAFREAAEAVAKLGMTADRAGAAVYEFTRLLLGPDAGPEPSRLY